METLYIVCGLVVLVVLIALGITLFNVSLPAQPPSSGVCSPSDSPYVPTSSQQRPYQPAIRYSQTPSGYDRLQAPSQPSPYQPHRLSGAQYPPPATTPQQSHRPVARASLVVPVVIDPRECPTAKAPEVPVARVVIDPHEDPKSLRLKATQEGDRMGKCFKERNEAKARNDQQRAKELTQRGEAHRANMILLDKEASAKIFQENNQNRRNKVETPRTLRFRSRVLF
ncbi:uncharacterized protein HD556DRAFT_1331119 [Suillus plorans]|uniref:DUF1771 domain-containing protein n=1 Tax=Suillus plorans TaxID=116603 RepID=A0A9P7J4L8_9AGAM|nr:uncharacterized protein HD556DRAFT_1331119 [Suillus plorans]KAG1802624.1 hypothetical protein HD556DRAFT_1331119 [Suillus plorans]